MADEIDLEELGLDLPFYGVGPGRKQIDPRPEYKRELTMADLAMPPVAPAAPTQIKSLRDSHHAIARCLATGMKDADVSAVTGYSLSRLSVLKADPTFAELVEHYRAPTAGLVNDFRERMANVGMDVLSLIAEKIEDEPEKLSMGLLNELLKTMADRTGHAPQRGPTTAVQVNVTVNERIKAARERLANRFGVSAPMIEAGSTGSQ